jgi:hypothetical protein
MGVSEAKVTLVTGPGNQSDCARIKEVRSQNAAVTRGIQVRIPGEACFVDQIFRKTLR